MREEHAKKRKADFDERVLFSSVETDTVAEKLMGVGE
jgi:hypothetical protein